ncbi:MAG: DinB family protein [Candidatus Sulfotelmatobacter sp.]
MSLAKQVLLVEVRQSAWANRNSLDACSALAPEELERDLRISHTNLLSTLRHICDGERVWLDCLRTTPDGGTWRLPQGAPPEPSFEELSRTWPVIWTGFEPWLEALPETSLEKELMLQLPGGIERSFPRWQILRHVLSHSTMHRGQIVGMIRMLGHHPPPSSFMDYYLAQ